MIFTVPPLGDHRDPVEGQYSGRSAPARKHHGHPQLGSCGVGDFLAANSTGTNRPAEETDLRLLFQRRFFRWRSSVLKLKRRLWQNSLRRMPLFMNSAANC
jgi:hypothetical protein